MSEGLATSEITVPSQNQTDVEALVQAAVSVLTNDMQQGTIHTSHGQNTVQLLVDTCTSNNIQDRLFMCTDCNVAFYGEQGEQEWQWHLRTHKQHKCDLCSEAFEDKESLKTHMRSHTLTMPFICDKCGSAYSLKSNLIQHMKTHEEKVYNCNECQVEFRTEQDLDKHMRFHSGEMVSVYQCEECQKTFSHQKNLAQHMKIHQGVAKQYKCPECPASYSYKCHLTRHLMIHTGDKPYKCKFCGKAFNRNAHLVRHRKIHQGGEKEWKCEQCDYAFYEKSDLVRHIKSHEGNRPFKCDYCDQTFVWKRYLYKHLNNNHKADDRHFCMDCCLCFPTDEALFEHKDSTHKKQLTHTCNVCGEEFYFKYKLDEHMYQHTGRKAHECDKCPEKFISRKELDRHKQSHAQDVSFSCNTCQKQFFTTEELQRHLRIHTGGGRYRCAVCGLSFRWRSQLTNHMVVHSSDHDFGCSICEKEFKRKRDLIRHVKIYHDTKPPFTCTECNEDFHTPFNLHQHKTETHWKKQDEFANLHSCHKCSGLFRVKADLDKHLVKVHPPRPYYCCLCSKRFTCLKWIETHFELKHPGEIFMEGTTYVIKPSKDNIVETAVADPMEAENGTDEVLANEEGNDEEVMEQVDNEVDDEVRAATEEIQFDHEYTDHMEVVTEPAIVESAQQNVIVVQTVEEQLEVPQSIDQAISTDQTIHISTSPQQAPMSEAITLAEFSQQPTGNSAIPVFLQESKVGNILAETKILDQSKFTEAKLNPSVAQIIAQQAPRVVSATGKSPKIIKISRSQAQALLSQNKGLNAFPVQNLKEGLLSNIREQTSLPQSVTLAAPVIQLGPGNVVKPGSVPVIHMPEKVDGSETIGVESVKIEHEQAVLNTEEQ